MSEWLTDAEKRLLFTALGREKKVCKQVDEEMGEQELVKTVKSLENKFYYNKLFNEIYKQGVKDFAKYLIDRKVTDYSEVVDLVIAFLDKGNADPNPCDTKGCSTSTRQSCCGCPERLEWEKRRRKKKKEYFEK